MAGGVEKYFASQRGDSLKKVENHLSSQMSRILVTLNIYMGQDP